MRHTDRKAFAEKMAEMMYAFARQPDAGIVDSYFKQLAGFSLEYALRAIDEAIRQKRQGDLYEQRQVPTVPEVARIAREIFDSEKPRYLDDFCSECNYTGYIIEEKNGRTVARKCECLLRRIEQQCGGGKNKKKIFS